MDRRQNILILSIIGAVSILMVAAYLYSERERTVAASKPRAAVKKFRAKPGTQRKNARALMSSVPSVPEETTKRPLDIWGSLDANDPPPQKGLLVVIQALDMEDTGQAIDNLLEKLEETPADGAEADVTQLQTALAVLYAQQDPPDLAVAEAAFARALEEAPSAELRLYAIAGYGKALLILEEFETIIAMTRLEDVKSGPFTIDLLEVGVLRGIALENVGRDDDARAAYEEVIDRTLRSGIASDDPRVNVFRLASLRLSRLLRAQGKTTEATAVARRMRAWLAE